MSSMDINKIVAAVLLAGIVAMLSGFIAKKLVHVPHHGELAYKVEGVAPKAAAEPQAATAEVIAPIGPKLAGADLAAGQAASKKCVACHSFDEGGANKVGPNLWGVVGGKTAHVAGFAYSAGLQGKGGIWGFEELNQFLANPKAYVPGTKMAFAGLKAEGERAAIIAWLNSLSKNPLPLPQ